MMAYNTKVIDQVLYQALYKCFIDDILILWPHSELELNNFLHAMNSFHPSIKFTSERSYQKINFLDINIYTKKLLI